jgi:hypothetical protein
MRHTPDVLIPSSGAAAPMDFTALQTWTPLVSIGIAVAAFILSLLNRRTASHALRLSLAQEERRAARLDLQIIEHATWQPKGADYRWLIAQVLVINRSDRDGSIIKAELKVGYSIDASTGFEVHIPHAAMPSEAQSGVQSLNIPVLIKANDALAGWLTFKIDHGLVGNNRVEEYEIAVYDSRGPIESVHIWATREIVDEGDKAQSPSKVDGIGKDSS